MSNNGRKPDHTAINAALRVRPNRVNWTPTSSRNPVDQQRDRDALNRALRRAGGKDAPEPDAPAPFAWRSIGLEGDDVA